MVDLDHLEAEAFSALGVSPIVWIDCAAPGAEARAAELSARTRAIVGGLDRAGACPACDSGAFDLLLTNRSGAPAPWVTVRDVDRAASAIDGAVRRTPVAATVMTHVLRVGERLPFAAGLQLESLAYSTLLGGAEFRGWRAAHPATAPGGGEQPFLRCERDGDVVTITLARPGDRNAICAGMRDALHEALCAVLDDPSSPRLLLRGDGACFSTGGSLGEFGTATDLAIAHTVRTLRSCALRLHELGSRATVLLHGACIGSGIEIPAAAAHRLAVSGAFFQLPELAMGLMPGAGGTVSVARAIGRHRTCYMALSGRRIAAATAAHWGLIEREAA